MKKVPIHQWVRAVCGAVALFTAVCGIAKDSESANAGSPGKRLKDPAGIHNLFALGTNVYSGSTPEGEEGFAALQKLGVKTIISVDGAKPEVDLARKHGMRYVHLPHGYDGIGADLQLRLAKAGQVLPGPIYVHCHHGKHRGPTAAAIICMANDSLDARAADAWLQAAGTSTNYGGLYRSVREFAKPSARELAAESDEFPESARVSGLVEAMVGIDERWEHLKAVRAAGYGPPKEHPDIEPANEAVILWEHYREAQRLPDATALGGDFIEQLRKAELEVKEAERLLRAFAGKPGPTVRDQLDSAFNAIGKTCASCHKAFRDARGTRTGE